MHQNKKNKGSALLTALFIMTLVAIVATAMSMRLQLDIYRTRLIIMHDKLYLASQAVSFWSFNELSKKNLKLNQLNKQGMVAIFPEIMKNRYKPITLSGGLYDMQARFNLNNLLDKKYLSFLVSLMAQADSNLNAIEINNIVLAVRDWLLDYDLSRGKDLYTAYYLAQNPAYYPSHQLMTTSSEFRMIKDVKAPTYLALMPYITVLPETTAININTAPKQILMSLGNGLRESQANELIMARGGQGINDLKDISELLKKLDIPKEQITIESHYYLSVAHATSDEFDLVVYTLFRRNKDKKGKLSVSIVRESINSL